MTKLDEFDGLKDALESMVYQFAYPTAAEGQPGLCTGGLSALEEAFEALGWDDPHIIEKPVWCDGDVTPRCPQAITSGTPTLDGYKHYCSEHAATGREAYSAWCDQQEQRS